MHRGYYKEYRKEYQREYYQNRGKSKRFERKNSNRSETIPFEKITSWLQAKLQEEDPDELKSWYVLRRGAGFELREEKDLPATHYYWMRVIRSLPE